MEMLLFSLLAAWVSMRYIGGDAVAAVRGTESARTRDRRAREQIATERMASGRGPSVGQALADRVADRIANPPARGPRGPAREALARWWQDVWAEADRRRRERAAGRRPAAPPDGARPSPPPPRPDDDDVVDGEVVEDLDTGPTDEDYTGPTEPVSLDKESLIRPPADDRPTDPPAPEPPVATVHPIRGDLDMSDTPNGETLDPTAASAFVNQCKEAADGLVTAIEQSIASLTERGVAGAPIDLLEQMRESAGIFAGHAEEADGYFRDHIGKAADLSADDTVAGTVKDTYLDAANA